MCRPPSCGRVRRRACGLPYPASGRRSRPSVALHVCFLTGAPRRRRPGRCSPFHAPIPPASSGVRQRGEVVIPRSVVRGLIAVVHPRSLSPRTLPGHFGCTTARYVNRPQAAMGSRHRPGMVPGPAGDRPPSSCPRRRSNSDHAGKSTYSGKIQSLDRYPGIATLVPGMRFFSCWMDKVLWPVVNMMI